MLTPVNTHAVGPIERFMVEDHVRIDESLRASEMAGGAVDAVAYERLRQDLLRHIGMEEMVLLPFASTKRGGVPLPLAPSLRADHGAIAKLLVRPPSPGGLAALRALLDRHNPLEEGPDGLYAVCDGLAGLETLAVVARLQVQPCVPLAPWYDGPIGRGA